MSSRHRNRPHPPSVFVMLATSVVIGTPVHAQKPGMTVGGPNTGLSPVTGPVTKPVPVLTGLQQIAALEADKATWTPAQRKMDSHLVYAIRAMNGMVPVPGVPSTTRSLVVGKNSRVKVILHGVYSRALQTAVVVAGGEVAASFSEGKIIAAAIPLSGLTAIAGRSDITFIALPGHGVLNEPRKQKAARSRTHPLVPYVIASDRRRQLRGSVADALATNALRTSGIPAWALLPAVLQGGTVDSEGDATHQANLARTNYNISGAGINIGVMSNGDGNYVSEQTAGALPSNVTIVPGQDGSGGEGTAMMEIVYDLAPSASLFFATAEPDEVQFASNIETLRNTYNCDIIIDDFFYTDEAPYQDGPVALAVNSVTASGAFYYSSAGNQGHLDTTGNDWNDGSYYGTGTNVSASVWEGDFSNNGATIGTPYGNYYIHQYAANGTTYNYNTSTEFASNNFYSDGDGNYYGLIQLSWSDPLGSSTNDYDMYVLEPGGGAVWDSSTNYQDGAGEPEETCALDGAGSIIYVVKAPNAAPCALDINVFGDGYNQAMQFVTNGQTHGHSSAANAFSVAAAPAATTSNFYPSASLNGPYPGPFVTSSPEEVFTSDGPRRIFYNADGSAVTAGNFLFATNGGLVRTKPDITAADGVSTNLSGFDPFYGTSAAAPHAGAIAGLIKSYSSSSNGLTINGYVLSNADMHTVMDSATVDICEPGYDNNTGYGIIMPISEIQFLQDFLSGAVTATPADTTAILSWNTNLPSTTAVNYGTTTALGSSISSSTPTTSHTATLAGLQPNTTYFYEIASATASGAVSYTDTSARSFVTTSTTRPVLGLGTVTASNGAGVTSVSVQITDTGGVAANVQITAASLAGEATATTLPVNLGSIPAGSSATTSLTFPLIASGTHTVLNVTASDGTGAVYTLSVRVAIP